MDLAAKLAPDSTDIAMPTSCTDSVLRSAVTTTSSRPAASLADVEAAGSPKLVAQEKMAAPAKTAAKTLELIPILPEQQPRDTRQSCIIGEASCGVKYRFFHTKCAMVIDRQDIWRQM